MNVVTIDFDIIMAPSIEGYNSMIGADFEKFHDIEEINPVMRHCLADLYLYNIIFTLVIINTL